ncbi:oxygenase MpaB family protein [Streptomyces chryseus]
MDVREFLARRTRPAAASESALRGACPRRWRSTASGRRERGRLGRAAGRWSFFVVMPRALLLQVAHPAVSAGVVQHSAYRGDPWRRWWHTDAGLRQVMSADEERGRLAGQALRRSHRGIRGSDRHGRPYHAVDHSLFLWVHATYFDSVRALYRLRGTPLEAQESEELYGDWRRIGRRLGLPAHVMPADLAAFDAYFARALAGLERTESVEDLLGPAPLVPPGVLQRVPLADWCWRTAGRLLFPHINRAIVATLPEAACARLGVIVPPRVYLLLARTALWLAHLLRRTEVAGRVTR